MAYPRYHDRVKETSTATGTGDMALAGAVTLYKTVSSRYADEETLFYVIEHQSLDEWEVGYGSYETTGNVLTRVEVLASSNADALVNFSAGTKHIFVAVPAANVNADPSRFNARLTLETGVPVSSTDQTAKTTLYLTPYKGKTITMLGFDETVWRSYTLEADLSLSLTGLIKGVTYDIFVYPNGATSPENTLEMEAVPWKKVTASNNPTAGSSKQIDLADTDTLVVGMDVTVRDGSASEIARITTVNAGTSIVVDTLANSYTTPDVYGYRARDASTLLSTHDGVLVLDSNKSERYVGSIAITATTGETEDSATHRGVWNYYNRALRRMARSESTDTWTWSTASWHQTNASKSNQLVFVSGMVEDMVHAVAQGQSSTSTATGRARMTGVGQNRTATNDAQITGYTALNNVAFGETTAFYDATPPIGRNYLAWLEYGGGTDVQTWYGDLIGATVVSFGIVGQVWG